jgi:hypothetical protein
MSKGIKFLAVTTVFLLYIFIFFLLFPTIPGQLLLSSIPKDLPLSMDVVLPRLQITFADFGLQRFTSPRLALVSTQITLKHQQQQIHIDHPQFIYPLTGYFQQQSILDFYCSALEIPLPTQEYFSCNNVLGQLQLTQNPQTGVQEADHLQLKIQGLLTLPTVQLNPIREIDVKINLHEQSLLLDCPTLLIDHQGIDYFLSLPAENIIVHASPYNLGWNVDTSLTLYSGEIAIRGTINPSEQNCDFSLKDIDLKRLFMKNSDFPHQILATLEYLKGNLTIPKNQFPTGQIQVKINQGTMKARSKDQQNAILPVNFGEIPLQLGLTENLSSSFTNISGEITFNSQTGAVFTLEVLANSHRILLKGLFRPNGQLAGNLTLHLTRKTLASNTLNLDFDHLPEHEGLNIYGTITGLWPNTETVWDVDRQKLIQGAARGIKKNLKKNVQNLFKLW